MSVSYQTAQPVSVGPAPPGWRVVVLEPTSTGPAAVTLPVVGTAVVEEVEVRVDGDLDVEAVWPERSQRTLMGLSWVVVADGGPELADRLNVVAVLGPDDPDLDDDARAQLVARHDRTVAAP